MQGRCDAGQVGYRTGGIQERRNVGNEGCKTGGKKERRCFFHSMLQFLSFRLLSVLFREIRNIRNLLSHSKASFAKQGAYFREIRNSFRMKFSRILYGRNSSVNPNCNSFGPIIYELN